jgi:hypothetical protein
VDAERINLSDGRVVALVDKFVPDRHSDQAHAG